MPGFKQQAERALFKLFEDTDSSNRKIKRISEKADELHRTLANQPGYEFELTVEKIVKHLEKRKQRGPKWAWNSWIGTLEFIGAVPEGYQI